MSQVKINNEKLVVLNRIESNRVFLFANRPSLMRRRRVGDGRLLAVNGCRSTCMSVVQPVRVHPISHAVLLDLSVFIYSNQIKSSQFLFVGIKQFQTGHQGRRTCTNSSS